MERFLGEGGHGFAGVRPRAVHVHMHVHAHTCMCIVSMCILCRSWASFPSKRPSRIPKAFTSLILVVPAIIYAIKALMSERRRLSNPRASVRMPHHGIVQIPALGACRHPSPPSTHLRALQTSTCWSMRSSCTSRSLARTPASSEHHRPDHPSAGPDTDKTPVAQVLSGSVPWLQP